MYRDFLKKNWKEIAFLFVLVCSSFFMFNRLNFSSNRWTVHPDDQDIMVFSKVLFESGRLWYQSPYNREYETKAFYPPVLEYGSDQDAGYKIHASYAPGIYFMTCPGNFFGYKGPFFIVGLFGIAGILVFYLFARKLFGISTAMIAAVFLAFLPPYAYWSDALFTNIPALFFLMGGLYFLASASKRFDRKSDYFLASASFILAVWIRGDYIFPAGIAVIAFLVGFRREVNWKYVLQSFVIIVLMVCALGAINFFTTGSVVGVVPAEGGASKAAEVLVRYPLRSISPGVMYNNFRHYVYGVAPLLFILAVLGVVTCIFSRDRANPFLAALFLIGLFALFYYGKNSSFWGYDRYWLASSYSRYFLPLYAASSVFAAIFTVSWLERLAAGRSRPANQGESTRAQGKDLFRWIAVGAGVLLITAQLVFSIGILSRWDFGFDYTESWNRSSKSVDDFVSKLPEDAVVVNFAGDTFFKKMIVSRTVFNPFMIEDGDRLGRSAEILTELNRKGIPVYIINNIDLEMKEMGKWDSVNKSFHLKKMDHDIEFKIDVRKPDIYKFIAD